MSEDDDCTSSTGGYCGECYGSETGCVDCVRAEIEAEHAARTCATCKHWSRQVDAGFDNKQRGVCTLVRIWHTAPGALAVIEMRGGASPAPSVALSTLAEFGCNSWVAKR